MAFIDFVTASIILLHDLSPNILTNKILPVLQLGLLQWHSSHLSLKLQKLYILQMASAQGSAPVQNNNDFK